MRISDWSSDVCSSDLRLPRAPRPGIVRSFFFMKYIFAAASLVALVTAGNGAPAAAQARDATLVGPPSSTGETVRTGPLPARLTLAQAMEEADARSPRVVAAEAEVEAARGRQDRKSTRLNSSH